jgi:hypothetical protein
VVVAARSDHALPALVPPASMAWAAYTAGPSGGLWLWRLLSRNPNGRPLWNGRATLAAAAGAFLVAFALVMPEPPGVGFPAGVKAAAGVLAGTMVACVTCGGATGLRHVGRKGRPGQGA